MKVKLKIEKEYDAKTLHVSAGVRYWEDAEVNGVEDVDGDLIPCRNGDNWTPIIDLSTGKITNWEQGKTAKIHYKVCDDGSYELRTASGEIITKIDGYVPDTMCPDGNGYGDYIKMTIDENGIIENFKFKADDFESED